jgi:hypothetical protein
VGGIRGKGKNIAVGDFRVYTGALWAASVKEEGGKGGRKRRDF